MAHNLTTHLANSRKPALQTPDQYRYLTALTSAVATTPGGDLEVSHLSAPTPRLRGELQGRLDDLRHGISPDMSCRDTAASLLKMIVDLFDAYPTVKMDVDKAQGVARTFASHVEHLPLWAVEEGIFECQGRKTPFPPSPGELKAASEKRLAPVQDEIAQITKVLDAKVYHQNSDSERERVTKGFQDLLSGLRRTNGFSPPPRRAQDYRESPEMKAQVALDSMNYREEPIPLSDAARTAAGYARQPDSREAAE